MIEIINLTKTFNTPEKKFNALEDINLTINDGDIFGIIGMSGAGKSTLVRCINMLERPTDGHVIVNGVQMDALSPAGLRVMRKKVTMIFQGFNLLMQRTCIKNVMLPLKLSGVPRAAAKEKALKLLELVGLPDKANAYPSQLSGGQQQRVAIARALATNPDVLLCDEATSALDPKTTRAVLELIRSINEQLGITVIVITHQMSVVQEICSKVAILENGRIVETGPVDKVFANPVARATKNLVCPEMADNAAETVESKQKIRISFNGAASEQTKLISKLTVTIGTPVSIIGSNTRIINNKLFGYMVLDIHGENAEYMKATEYLSKIENVSVQNDADTSEKEFDK